MNKMNHLLLLFFLTIITTVVYGQSSTTAASSEGTSTETTSGGSTGAGETGAIGATSKAPRELTLPDGKPFKKYIVVEQGVNTGTFMRDDSSGNNSPNIVYRKVPSGPVGGKSGPGVYGAGEPTGVQPVVASGVNRPVGSIPVGQPVQEYRPPPQPVMSQPRPVSRGQHGY